MKLVLAVLLVLVTGCASVNKEYAAQLAAAQSIAQAQAAARQEQVRQMGMIAQSGDATAKAVAVMAMAMIQMPSMEVPRPPESEALKWAAVLMPAITNLGMGYYTYAAGKANSNAQRDIAISTNQAFSVMGGHIATAGTAGYPFIQAPGPITTTTTTTTNTTTNSNNTTRTCNGGNAGAAVPPAIPGAGGAANC